MKKAFLLLFSVILFITFLEFGSKLYVESLGYYQAKPSSSVVTPMGSWKNLPYKVRIKEGRVVRVLSDGKVVLDVPYKIDSGTRRESYPLLSDAQEYLVFIGCSFTFGAGVTDTETLPSQFQKKSEHYRVYNYGIGGASPEEILYRLQNISTDELQEKSGRVIYSFFTGHFNRHFYLPDFVGRWGYTKYVYEKKAGKVVILGTYEKLHPYRTLWYKLRWESYFYQLITEVFPDTVSEDQIKSFTDFVGEMSLEAKRLTGKRMVMIIWPGYPIPTSFIGHLKNKDLDYLDLSTVDLKKITNGNDRIPYDGHPTAASHDFVARELKSFLEKLP